MIALGYDSYGRTSNVEVIDLENPEEWFAKICQNILLPQQALAAFINFEEEPEICGGYDGDNSFKAK